MKKLRLILAIIAGKLAMILSRLLGNQGTDFPGRVARWIYPGILKDLAVQVRQKTVLVTGTNGKTTTSNLIACILRARGSRLVHNQAGANMMSGITTAFIRSARMWGRQNFDYALLETDEANVPLLLEEVPAHIMVVTNFFRDQLDRYGELDTTIGLIIKAVKKHPLDMVLNADDPLSAPFRNSGLTCHFYGFAPTRYDAFENLDSREGRYCLLCGSELVYQRFHYAQLGQFHCPGCGQQNPAPEFMASDLQMEPLVEFMVGKTCIESQYQGFYNGYNLLAAYSLGSILGVPEGTIQRALASYKPQAGRMEQFCIGGRDCLLVLVKNPAGLNQSLATLLNRPGRKNLFFALNDNAADGRDISWIWDADVEMLGRSSTDITMMVCSGQRSGDIAIRAKYAGLDTGKLRIIPSLERGIEATIAGSGDTSFILCTYTALFPARKIIAGLERKQPSAAPRRSKASP
ncbi:MAG TPA: MurT ligase domain-containing protein [Syntrophomonadaceae bacterium]|nr:MurT ligase domain-containing protein [Syntrophomonadaceae bacterium]